ncbi:protein WVD2-like 7 [Arachis duranensis]|uniref:Protein WVD2-like 7 n=1 Tax=Arachis duranensis TaxID=130453 RepID=A0A6P5NBP5_ARADU|nr:protein WVD2-like 7 [Arachis duranensis]XP_015957009.1 protein WVD2-like 7 [Arachis duranensis]XP_015957011.1 protein WVD2-like 7 [Arachis duranensis]XP_015957012.1 protein WVD2-like 7 [Arachis duranensis]XP_020994857.1 protein WVD2-like 7 [Arachis duranensis]
MGETASAAANHALQVSVSFGRFDNDSLSWERWSAFSPNKYLEEVEKCATPGSVAQKKAYFEAHYKNIAARKAELLAQGRQLEKDPFGSPHRNGEDLSCDTCGDDAGFDVSNNTQGSIDEVKQESSLVCGGIRTELDHLEDDVVVSRDHQSPSIEGENQEMEGKSDSFQKDKPEEVVSVEQEGNSSIEAENVKEISHNVDYETEEASEVEAKDVKLDYPKVSEKFGLVNPVNKESSAAKLKQKSAPVSSKASQISTPRGSRPTSTPSQISTPRSSRPSSTPSQISTPRSSTPKRASTPTKTPASATSAKRGNSPSFSGKKATSPGEPKKVPNKSLHMSLSLGPSKPDPTPAPVPNSTMRKSLIMEKMGDKDIVKRAFKTFQNSFSQSKSFGEDKFLVKKQISSMGTEQKAPTSLALRKENGKDTKVQNMDKRSGNAVRTSLGLKSDIKAEKGKESPRKIEEKPNAKEVERTRLQLKSKEEKVKHNFKATPQPAFHRGPKVSKSYQEKGNVKIEKVR